MKLTNEHNIALPLAVWLMHDDYDYRSEANYISATGLLKSIKQTVLAQRVAASTKEADISDFIAARFGHAVHDSVENAWRKSGQKAMARLGYNERIHSNIVINPTEEQIKDNPKIIPIWIEQRTTKEIDGYLIGGKFDMVMDGRLFDFKTTSVWSYIYGGKDEDYQLQGSIYRWLNPEIITEEYIYIQFLFTDWQRSQAKRDPKYPQIKIKEHPVPLLSLTETERFIKNKLSALSRSWLLPEEELPPCNDKELWRSDPVWKYYKDPNKTDRATKNFNNANDANAHLSSQGGKGIIKHIPGEVKACEYCAAFSVCKQKDQYFA